MVSCRRPTAASTICPPFRDIQTASRGCDAFMADPLQDGMQSAWNVLSAFAVELR